MTKDSLVPTTSDRLNPSDPVQLTTVLEPTDEFTTSDDVEPLDGPDEDDDRLTDEEEEDASPDEESTDVVLAPGTSTISDEDKAKIDVVDCSSEALASEEKETDSDGGLDVCVGLVV